MSATLAYRIDGRQVEARAFYRSACDPRRSVVVEACAGAGKTWMLVSRILRALLAGAEPGEILAITFTRKAAGEMRERLQQWLREFALATPEARREALRQRGCTEAEAEALQAPLGALYPSLLAAGRGVEIRTFHGWFGQLMRAAPIALLEPLGLHPDVDTLEDREDLRPAYTRRFLRAVAADAGLRADYAELVALHGRQKLAGWLEAAIDQRIEFERADAAGTLEASVPAAAVLWPGLAAFDTPHGALREAALVARLQALARELGCGGKKAVDAAQALEAGLALTGDAEAFAAIWIALHTKQGEPRKLGDFPAQLDACDALRGIAEAHRQQEAHGAHARLVRLARALLAAYAAVKRQRGLADMADLELCAAALLADAELAAWVQQRLDTRIRHLLIDEFQDTSPLQWRTLEAWLAGYAGAGGGASGQRPLSLFVVGDPKQSIYGFRRADPRVFVRAREFVVEGLQGAHLACDHTRRNAPAIVEAMNAVFTRAQELGEFDGFRPHTTAALDAPGAVRLLPVTQRPERERAAAFAPGWRDTLTTPRVEAEEALRLVEARRVADAIAQLVQHEGHAPDEVLVLGRKRVALGWVAQALRERGIAHVLPEERRLDAAPEVADLLALLDALVLPTQDLALARALRSPVFGASDDDLIALALAVRERGGTWWDALLEGRAASPALARASTLLPAWREAAGRLPPHDLLDRIVFEGGVRARYAAALPPAARALGLRAIDALLAEALKLDGARYATPYNFVRALRRRRVLLPTLAEERAVQLLTIHGAKGLEARAVFLIDTEPQAPKADGPRLAIDWPADADHPSCCAFVAADLPPSLADFAAAEAARRAREELNALYVAMTRARELLVLSATAPHVAAPGPSPRQRVVLALGGDESVAAHAMAPPAARPPADRLAQVEWLELPRLPAREVAAVGARRSAPAEDDKAAQLGRAVHRVLEWHGGSSQAGAIPAAARAAADEFGLAADAAARIESIAAAILASPDCARFFDPPRIAWAGNEVPVGRAGQVLRIDRLVALRGDAGQRETWWVLDYKLRGDPLAVPAYREQLVAYADAVRRLQPGFVVRAAFITGEGRLVEWPEPAGLRVEPGRAG
ncbi:MAG TPA: UvrD-helicase domain-containing protein [Methylibium sp.]|uniref:UvrD-helicase domain-containing protein n=1 Tax=Methylibium sp. TaxID=2067992 RepID=UPI002DB789FC|nr:UvrD-helicase domain-containing protein [Methylibium sp.]HEU4459036.1 UvrD-helicase domain-containing protein [Methylibium sp.]